MVDLNGKVKQKDFGELVGISQPAVSDLVARGILDSDGVCGDWVLSYCDHLREVAAGRATEGGIALATERALLAREQRIKIEMQNAVTRKELAPAALLTDILSRVGVRCSRILEALPGKLRRLNDKLTAADLRVIETEIAQCRNQCAAISLEDLDKEDFFADGDEAIDEEGGE